MGRFDQLFKKVGEVADPQVQPGDETAVAENPRNWLTDKVNTVLPESMQIPAQTVAENKMHMQMLPETMAGGTMGSLKSVGTKALPHADVMAHPKMREFLSPEFKTRFKAENPHPSQYDAAKQAIIKKIQQGE